MSQPAGWYPQPDGSQRYWDGQAWTPHIAPAAPPSQPGQAGASAPAGPGAKPKKPIYKRVWFWLALVFVLIVISMLGRGGSSSAGPEIAASTSAASDGGAASDQQSAGAQDRATTQPSEEAPQDKVAKIGDTIRVGDLAVTVESAERKSKLSSPLGSEKGHWMLITVKVANKGKDQVMVNDSDFTLVEADGTTYSTDSDGMTYIDSDDWLFLKKINPKTSATGKILFAIPDSAKNLTLRASGGLFGLETGDISLGSK